MSPTNVRFGGIPLIPSGSYGPSFQKVGLAGLDRVIHKLNEEIKKIEGASLKGLIKSAIIIRRDVEDTPPITPLDLGNLRASFFTVTSSGSTTYGKTPKFDRGPGKTGRRISAEQVAQLLENHSKVKAAWASAIYGDKPIVALGYTANYAVFVHEMMGPIRWSRQGSGPKWFQAAIRRNRARILQTIADNVRIKR
jgi:hypothetical protein